HPQTTRPAGGVIAAPMLEPGCRLLLGLWGHPRGIQGAALLSWLGPVGHVWVAQDPVVRCCGAESTRDTRVEMVPPCKLSTTASLSLGGTVTLSGATMTRHPAACPEVAPVRESSIPRHRSGCTPSRVAASRYGSGSGLPTSTWSP